MQIADDLMPIPIAVEISVTPSNSVRARQLSAAFDVPPSDRQVIRWNGSLPLDERDWQIGLIVGPSGSGKSTLLRHLYGEPERFQWNGAAVVDDFPERIPIEDVVSACSAVGFNTIPAWLRPFRVLSNGEQFRVTLARLLAESEPQHVIAVDEFTSVVDRQVAQIGSHAVAKWIRHRPDHQFVAASCHYDIEDWLQPDWTLEPATMDFRWRLVQPRPRLTCTIGRVPRSAWRLFAPYHYLTADLHKAARCFALFIGERPAAFAGVLHRPHPTAMNIKGLSRLVTLPDWQGLGLAFVLADTVAAAYKARHMYFHMYPAHPSLIRSFDRSPKWQLRTKPAAFGSAKGKSSTKRDSWRQSARPNAVFRYVGSALADDEADRLLDDKCSK
jgi:GNAT superfamily N-acetyltransferase